MVDAQSERPTGGQPRFIRTFVAVEMPSEIKAVLRTAQDEFRRIGGSALPIRWTDPDGFHLTLKYLGMTRAELISDVERELEWGLLEHRAFALALGATGVFPNPHAPRVLWVGVRGDLATLAAIRDVAQRAIAPLGFPTENRPFAPHLTLGRFREEATADERRRLGAALAHLALPPTEPFRVEAVTLMRSDTGPAGARYTPIFALPLRERK